MWIGKISRILKEDMIVRNEVRLFCYFYATWMLRGSADKVTNEGAEGVVFTSRMIRKYHRL